MTPTRPPRFLASRLGITAAAVTGFAIGAAGFAAAQDDDQAMSATPLDISPTSSQVPTTADDRPGTTIDLTIPDPQDDGPATTIDDGPATTIDLTIPDPQDDGPATTIDDGPATTIDDGPAMTIDDEPATTIDDGPATTIDDGPATTIDDGPATTIDDGPATTIDDGPATTIDDGPATTIDDGPTTTIGSSLPAPFSTSYSSAGGAINVTWSGTAFTLNSVSPVSGFRAEIEHQSWDRVRVDFEGDDHDARIEVRITDGHLRVRID